MVYFPFLRFSSGLLPTTNSQNVYILCGMWNPNHFGLRSWIKKKRVTIVDKLILINRTVNNTIDRGKNNLSSHPYQILPSGWRMVVKSGYSMKQSKFMSMAQLKQIHNYMNYLWQLISLILLLRSHGTSGTCLVFVVFFYLALPRPFRWIFLCLFVCSSNFYTFMWAGKASLQLFLFKL